MDLVSLSSLFWTFFKIGLFTFGGGFAMIPLIQREVIDKNNWVKRDDFLELLTLAQSAPGPIALNTSVFVGYKIRGYKGAFASILGVIVPSFVIILVVAMFFAGIRDNAVVEAAFKAMRPAVIALIIAPVITLSKAINRWLLIVVAMTALGVWYMDISPIYLMLAGALAGVLWSYYVTVWTHRKR